MSQFKTQKAAVEKEMGRYADEINAIWAKAKDEERDVTADEALEVNTRTKALKTLKEKLIEVEEQIAVEEQVREVGKTIGRDDKSLEFTQNATAGERVVFKSLGEMFTDSADYKSLKASGFSGNWTTSAVEADWQTKGTLLGGSGSPGSGTGGGLINPVHYDTGVIRKLFQPLRLENLIPSSPTTSNTVRTIVEGTATSGAAGVAEAGTKPESTLGLSTRDDPVKKVATVLHVADEMLEDANAVQAYINQRLSLFVDIEVERQLSRGAGTNEIYGFLDSNRAINIYAGGTAAGNKAVQIFKALNGTRGSSFLEPEAIIVHPTDWQEIRLLTDTAGQFFGGGPFMGPYGNGSQEQASGQVTGALDYLWGKPVIVTTALGNAGTALLGAFSQASHLWVKGGVKVDATNSHDDLFVKDIVTIRAERRFALSVYRPAAFTRVDLA